MFNRIAEQEVSNCWTDHGVMRAEHLDSPPPKEVTLSVGRSDSIEYKVPLFGNPHTKIKHHRFRLKCMHTQTLTNIQHNPQQNDNRLKPNPNIIQYQ